MKGIKMKATQEIYLAFLVLTLLISSIGMMQVTHGRFLKVFTNTDSTLAAAFDVAVTPPEEFWIEQGEHIFTYRFLSETDIKGLVFRATNNGETAVLCRPYFNGDLAYRLFVAEELTTEFILAAKETIDFWLILAPLGLDTNVREVEFFIDIQQIEVR